MVLRITTRHAALDCPLLDWVGLEDSPPARTTVRLGQNRRNINLVGSQSSREKAKRFHPSQSDPMLFYIHEYDSIISLKIVERTTKMTQKKPHLRLLKGT